eukprot:353775-Chlamydomonas_euryale.AAC.1
MERGWAFAAPCPRPGRQRARTSHPSGRAAWLPSIGACRMAAIHRACRMARHMFGCAQPIGRQRHRCQQPSPGQLSAPHRHNTTSPPLFPAPHRPSLQHDTSLPPPPVHPIGILPGAEAHTHTLVSCLGQRPTLTNWYPAWDRGPHSHI